MKEMRFLTRVVLCFLVMGVVFTALMPNHTEGKTIVWKASLHYKPVGLYGESVKWMSEEIAKRSQGRLTIEPYYSNALKLNVSAPLTAIKDGMVELNLSHMSLTMPEEPIAALPELPFLFSGQADPTMEWYFNEFLPSFEKIAASKWNTLILTPFMAPPIDIFSKDPIRTAKDLDGLRIRVYGGPVADWLKVMGASPYFISPAELYTALSQGMIKAAITSAVSASESNFWEVLKYVNRMNVTFGVGCIYMSKKAFDDLPKDLQEIVRQVGAELKAKLIPGVKKFSEDAAQLLVTKGMVEINPSNEFIEDATAKARPLWKKYADDAGPDGVAMLRKIGKYK
jgi:TRAP-type transport system periplasmic protein